jgi:hypothetical protein
MWGIWVIRRDRGAFWSKDKAGQPEQFESEGEARDTATYYNACAKYGQTRYTVRPFYHPAATAA